MGILPLEFPQGVTRKTLGLNGEERIDISNLQALQPGATEMCIRDRSIHCRYK